jgi:pyruvate dehydrogenase E2 component (dihydrolipoamide acetyltransferase)
VDEGTIAKILVPEGTQDVAVNDVIAVLAGDGEDVRAASAAAQRPAPQASAAPAPKPAAAPAGPAAAAASAGAAPAPVVASPPTAPVALPASQADGHGRIFASPLARRLAKLAGIDLSRIIGTGPHGRIIARDVEGAKTGKGLKAPAAAPAAGPAIAPSMSDKQVLALFEPGSYEILPHDNMRRTIAQRLTASIQTVPHFYLTIDCDIGKLLTAREEINAAAPKDKEKKPLYKISVNDFVIKAMAVALQKIPNCNVSWTEGGMLKHKHSDVGVAVAMPGGLITPIIRKAETKGLCGARPRPQAEAGGIPGRHNRSLQSRHVRHQSLHGCDQPAACDDPRRRHQRGAPRGARWQGRDRPHDERDAVLRSPRDRRGARRRADRRFQAAD